MSVMRPRAKRPHHRSTLNRLWSACHAEPLERRVLLTIEPVGADFTVNSGTTGIQANPAIAMDADGDYVVVWQSLGQDGDGWGIYGQLFDETGTPQGSEFRVNTTTFSNQVKPAVAMDPSGSLFVVAWQSYLQDQFGYGVYAQRFDGAAGMLGTEFQVDDFVIGDEVDPAVAIDLNGNFVITWTSPSTSPFSENNSGIFAWRYNAFGDRQGTLVHVNSYTPAQQNEPAIAMDTNGNYVVTWSSNGQDESGYGIYARRFDPFGNPQGTEFAVGPNTDRPQRNSDVALSDSGSFVVTWQMPDSSAFVRHFDQFNNPSADDQIAAIWTATTSQVQALPKVELDDDGNFIVMWTGPDDTGAFKGVYGIKFSPDLSVSSGEFRVNGDTARTARAVDFKTTGDGDIVAVWAGENPAAAANAADIFSRLLTDVDPTVPVGITRDVATVTEGDPTQSTYTVTRGSSTGDLQVRMTVSGTALGGSLNDFTFSALPNVNLLTDFTTLLVTIPDGQTSVQFTMVHNDDALVESPETVTISVNGSFSYVVDGGAAAATVTIDDNDVLSMVVEPTLLSITEGTSQAFSVVLTAPPGSDLVLDITKQGGGDDDLTADVTQLVFNAGNFNVPQLVTISAAQDADDLIGQATFTVSGGGLPSQNVLTVEADDEAAPTPTPGIPDLVAASDAGQSSTDNRTNLDNSNGSKVLSFDVPGTVVGASVILLADGVQVGSATATGTTTTITTAGALDLSDGNHVFVARQTELGRVISASSQGLTVAIDTVAPVVTLSEAGGQANQTDELPVRFSLLFSDDVWDLTFDDLVLTGTANPQTAVITGANRTYIASISGIFQSGTVIVNLPTGLVHDIAGNAADPTVIIDNQVTYTLNQILPPGGLPFTDLTAGKLTVNGTDVDTFPDVITVLADGTDVVVSVNGNAFRHAAADITSIEVYANAGNDRVTIGEGVIGTYVNGGFGNDTLIGGDGNDSLTGASGKDSLVGNAGNDRLAGGKHNDRILGGDGDDRLYGDEGNDFMEGGVGRDRMYGGDGNDTMFGGNHNDTMYGEAGNDSMDGQNHNDRLFAGTGTDTVRGGNGNDNIFAADGVGEVDVLNGGDGNDGVDADADDLVTDFEFLL